MDARFIDPSWFFPIPRFEVCYPLAATLIMIMHLGLCLLENLEMFLTLIPQS